MDETWRWVAPKKVGAIVHSPVGAPGLYGIVTRVWPDGWCHTEFPAIPSYRVGSDGSLVLVHPGCAYSYCSDRGNLFLTDLGITFLWACDKCEKVWETNDPALEPYVHEEAIICVCPHCREFLVQVDQKDDT